MVARALPVTCLALQALQPLSQLAQHGRSLLASPGFALTLSDLLPSGGRLPVSDDCQALHASVVFPFVVAGWASGRLLLAGAHLLQALLLAYV